MDILSSRKILSVTQQVLRPNTLNRVTWKFSSNGKSTNLAESYIVFRISFMNGATNTAITRDEYTTLLDKNLCISFGDQNGKSYTPASLIKHCRFFVGGSLVEEVLFSNVWTQTIAQLTNDIESLQSNSLLSCSVSNFSTNGSLANQISSAIRNYATAGTQGIPVEVHLKLSEIFGICKSTNFIMDKVGGEVTIQLELEDVKNVLQLRSIGQTYPLPPLIDVNEKLETSRFNVLGLGQGDVGQSTYKYTNFDPVLNPFNSNVSTMQVQNPDGLLFFGNLFKNFWDPTNTGVQLGATTNQLFFGDPTVTVAQMATIGFQVDNYVRLNFKRTDKSGLTAPVMFHYIAQIIATATGLISLSNPFVCPLPIIPDGTLTDTQLESVNVFRGWSDTQTSPPLTQQNACDTELVQLTYILDPFPATTSNISTFLQTGIIGQGSTATGSYIDPEVLYQLVAMGVLSTKNVNDDPETLGTEYVVNKDSSQIVIQMMPLNTAEGDGKSPYIISPCADVFENPDSLTQRKIFSNQAKTMPIQGTNCVIESVIWNPTSQRYSMKFANLGTEGLINNSLQVATVVKNNYGREGTVIPLGGTYPPFGDQANPQPSTGFLCQIYLYKHRSRNTTININDCIAGQTYRVNNVGTSTLAQFNSLIVAPEPDLTSVGRGTVFKCNASAVGDLGTATLYLVTRLENDPISWNIDKSEIVLVESSDVSLPMSNVFSTIKCEPFTIESASEIYNRQFVVPEPNVYNAYLMLPQDVTDGANKQSLISYNRNVQNIIWSINNIQNTNRPVELLNSTSSNPSSLQIEKMMEVFQNSEHKLKSLSGIQSIARTNRETPVVAPMVKIYSAIDAMNNYLKPSGCTLQINMNGDRNHEKLIIVGNAYLYKECLRMLPMM